MAFKMKGFPMHNSASALKQVTEPDKPMEPELEPEEITDYSDGEWEIIDKETGDYRPAMLNIDGSFLRWKTDDEIAFDKEEEAKFDEELGESWDENKKEWVPHNKNK